MTFNQVNYAKFRWIAYLLIAVALTIFWWWRIGVEQTRARDIQRVSDAVTIQAAFEKMFQHDRSYANAAVKGCDQAGLSVRRCSLREYYLDINQTFDPGKFDYIITRVPDQASYEVTFTLERDYQGLARGEHTISPGGIK